MRRAMSGVIYEIDEIKQRLESVFRENDVRSAILFGSYAKGEATEKSDVDICVDSDLKGLDFMVLVDDVYITLNKAVDVFPLRCVRPQSKTYNEIKGMGVVIYEK
jgi:predicted nucleotidyltransferase